jgi:hypothetical protein
VGPDDLLSLLPQPFNNAVAAKHPKMAFCMMLFLSL